MTSTSATDRAIAGLLACASATAGVAHASVTDLLNDETWTRTINRLPLPDVMPYIIQDGKHPPLYNVLERFVLTALPDTPFTLRLLSLVAIPMLTLVLYVMLRRLDVRRSLAIPAAAWVGLHHLTIEQAANARSYALFASVVTLYAYELLRFARTADGQRSTRLILAAVPVVLVHAFGILYVATLGTAMLLSADTKLRSRAALARMWAMAHVPALALFLGWFAWIFVRTSHTGGVTSGLQWLELPTWSERMYAWATLAGAPAMAGGATLTVVAWGACAVLLAWAHRQRPDRIMLGAVWLLAITAPAVGQLIASGVVLNLPLWGLKHIISTIPLLALWLAVAAESSGRAPLRMAVSAMLVVLTLGALIQLPRWRYTFFSEFAATHQPATNGMPVFATYAFGDVNILNYYYDRRCLDDFILREQFPQVRGPWDLSARASMCIAKPLTGTTDLGDSAWVLLRPTMPLDVRALDSVLASHPAVVTRTTIAGATPRELLLVRRDTSARRSR